MPKRKKTVYQFPSQGPSLEAVELVNARLKQFDLSDPIQEAAAHYCRFMLALGHEITEESLETPLRVARMHFDEFTSHHKQPPKVATFDGTEYDQYVIEKEIDFSSLCAHHHLPFIGVAHVGYHPNGKLAGLSKIPRTVGFFAARPQLQEQFVTDVAEYLFQELEPHGVMVIAKAVHGCMRCRGVRSNASAITSKIIGNIDKSEVLKLLNI